MTTPGLQYASYLKGALNIGSSLFCLLFFQWTVDPKPTFILLNQYLYFLLSSWAVYQRIDPIFID